MFFKKKVQPTCSHIYDEVGKYYSHFLTKYENQSDFIEVYSVRKCKMCMNEITVKIDSMEFPCWNKASFPLKQDYLSTLEKYSIPVKHEFILGRK